MSHAAPSEDLAARVERQVKPLLEGQLAPGLVVGLVDGSTTRVLGFGSTAVSGGRRPDGGTVYEIGSITKVFTGILLADMAERGIVRLEDPLASLLPAGVKAPEKDGRGITLLDLATHTSGLPRLPVNFAPKDPRNPYADYTEELLHAFLSGCTLERAPGERYEYSNLGMGLLGQVLARKAGASFEALLKERILRPLGMDSTCLALTPPLRSRLAPPHNADLEPDHLWDFRALAGAGAIRSTASDMTRFLRACVGLEETPLKGAIAASLAPRRDIGGGGRMGLGWHIRPDGQVAWHNGGTGGYRAMLMAAPARKRGVVVLCNAATPAVDALGAKLLEVLDGADPPPVSVRVPARVDPAVLAKLAGRYELFPGFVLTITVRAGRLMAQATGQPAVRIFPESETRFFYRVVEAQIEFVKNGKGEVESLVLHQGGRRMPGRRIP